jgi:hypothetical protein
LLAVLSASSATASGEPQVTVDDFTASEPLRGETGSLSFNVALEFPVATESAIPWTFNAGRQGLVEREISRGTLTIAPGQTIATLTFPLAADTFDRKTPYYYTVRIDPPWRNEDLYGTATVYDTTRDGEFACYAYAYLVWQVGGAGVGLPGCQGGFHHDQVVPVGSNRLSVTDYTAEVVQYADNGVDTRPAVGDGGETHVEMHGIVWRVAPGIVLRAASVNVDARIVCTAVGTLPSMESTSSVTGLQINGAAPLGRIDDEYVVDLGPAGRIIINQHADQAVVIASGDQRGEPHRTIIQSAMVAYLPTRVDFIGQTTIGQLFGNPCNS